MSWLLGRDKKDPKALAADRKLSTASREQRVLDALTERFPDYGLDFSFDLTRFERGSIGGEGHYLVVASPVFPASRLEELGLSEGQDYTAKNYTLKDGRETGLVAFTIKEAPLEKALGIQVRQTEIS